MNNGKRSARKHSAVPFIFAFLFVATSIYFADNVVGFYRFRAICKKEAGLHLFETLRRDEGWQTTTYPSREIAGYLLSQYPNIRYVRYFSHSESQIDLIRTAQRTDRWDSGFRSLDARIDTAPLYEYQEEVRPVPDHARTSRYTSIVKNLNTGRPALIYHDFTYRLFNAEWGLGRGTTCSASPSAEQDNVPKLQKVQAITGAFSK